MSQINDWLGTIGRDLGVSLSLNTVGKCYITTNDTEIVVVEHSDGLVCTVSGTIMRVTEKTPLELLLLALGKNLYQQHLLGAAIAYEPRMNELVLSFSRPASDLDETTFRNLLENMLAACAHLQTDFAEFLSDDVEAKSAASG